VSCSSFTVLLVTFHGRTALASTINSKTARSTVRAARLPKSYSTISNVTLVSTTRVTADTTTRSFALLQNATVKSRCYGNVTPAPRHNIKDILYVWICQHDRSQCGSPIASFDNGDTLWVLLQHRLSWTCDWLRIILHDGITWLVSNLVVRKHFVSPKLIIYSVIKNSLYHGLGEWLLKALRWGTVA
jgi:hypothetical protein